MKVFSALLPATLALACAAPSGAQTTTIGLSEVRGQWFDNGIPSPGMDRLGWAMATGDFNGDFVDDLAAGAPFAAGPAGNGQFAAGAVVVRYGQAGGGLGGATVVLGESAGDAHANEYFGAALAAGDFNGDWIEDLAVGIASDSPEARGAVRIYYGGPGGVGSGGEEILRESDAGEPLHACALAQFGWALAAGDFDGDSNFDLAIGALGGCERIGDELVRGGSVFVAHGSAEGFLPFVGYRISQNSFGFDPVEAGDDFGAAVAAGDFDFNGYDDLAIGIPGESDHGAVQIVMGSQFGLLFADNALWYPQALGEEPEAGDNLGFALATGDFDRDGHDDLAIGNPFEDLDPDNLVGNCGKVDIAYGANPPTWFDLARTDRLSQGDVYGSAAREGSDDQFGYALGAGDFDGDGYADLAIGHPTDDWSGDGNGAVTIVMGIAGGLANSDRFRHLGLGWEGIPGDAGMHHQYAGTAVAVGDFDDDGHADLAIGAPEFGGSGAGGLAVLYGALFADGFELGAPGRWSDSLP